MKGIRLLPVVVFGLVSLLSIRVMSLLITPAPSNGTQVAQQSIGERMARIVERSRGHMLARDLDDANDDQIITGSTGAKPDEAKAKKPDEANAAKGKVKPEPEGVRLPPPPNSFSETRGISSPAERELLEKLKDRREAIDARDRDLEVRDQLLRASERKLDDKIEQLRSLEGQGDAEKNARADPKQRYKTLVIMYETMKPKEAARVFDRLDTRVLLDLVGAMNPRKMSEILAAMDTAAAEKLTLAMARAAALPTDQPAGTADTELPRLSSRAAPAPVQAPRPPAAPKSSPD